MCISNGTHQLGKKAHFKSIEDVEISVRDDYLCPTHKFSDASRAIPAGNFNVSGVHPETPVPAIVRPVILIVRYRQNS